jgi:hypothetical protein
MEYVIRFVNSIEGIDAAKFAGDYFVLPDGRVYKSQVSDQLGFVAALIPLIAAAIPSVVGLFAGGGTPGQAKGLAGISAFGNQVLSELDALPGKLQSGEINAAQAIEAANKLVAILSDHSKVYQAKKGADAAALANFKVDAKAKAEQIKAFAASLPTPTQTSQTAAATGENSQVPFGLTTAQMAIGGVILFLVLRR